MYPTCSRVLLALVALVVGCKTATLSQRGEAVMVSGSAPIDHGYQPGSCQSLGYLVGRGGGAMGGAWISNEDLIEYAMNDLRNQAAERGANYVQHDSPQLGTSGSDGNSSTTTATVSGSAYRCGERGSQLGSAGGERPIAQAGAAPAPGPAPAPAPGARIWAGKDSEGRKDLRLTLVGGRAKLLLRAVPERMRDVHVFLLVDGKPATGDCEVRLASNGDRVELTPLPGPSEAATVPRATMTLDTLTRVAAAERVAGRICEHEFVVSSEDLAVARQYALQVREAFALLPDPAPAPASESAASRQGQPVAGPAAAAAPTAP